MRRVTSTTTALLGLALLVATPAGAGRSVGDAPNGGTPGTLMAGEIRHVANLPYTIQGSNGGGSDVEFATIEVTRLSGGATGEPVCATDESGACQVDENGETVYLTEQRDFAFLGRLTANGLVVDITNPETPVKVAEIPCALYQSDIQIQGSTLVVAADQGGRCTQPDGSSSGTFLGFATVDISDPRNPRYLARALEGRGAHNVTIHPTEPLVYISNSDQIGDGRVHIFDISDPALPVRVQDWVYQPVESPHDITFNADGSRAYLAARTFTHIVNTEDPRNPSMIASLPHAGYLSHQSDPTPDGKYLLVSEELLGGGFDTPSPGGPVHVWDIRDEAHPVELGAFGNDCVVVACGNDDPEHVSTSHVFRINPDGTSMGIAWYEDGVGVMDISDVRGLAAAGSGSQTNAGPRVVAWAKLEGADAWSAKMWQERHPGYLFVNDIARGFDVFHVPELDGGFLGFGTLRLGHRANSNRDMGVTRAEWEGGCDHAPASNGVDGWVQPIPQAYADGAHTLAVTSATAGPADPDLYFYDADCEPLGSVEDFGESETGPIPAGSAYVLVTSFEEGGLVKLRLSVS